MRKLLTARLLRRDVVHAISAVVETLKIHSVEGDVHCGRPVLVKTHHATGGQIAKLANFYFSLAEIPIRYCSGARAWQRWGIKCYRMLNGDQFKAVRVGKHTICEDRLPGESLWDHMKRGTLSRRMLKAAAVELHRAHQIWSHELGGLWSHGDASMPNVLYDKRSNRARLIDFEIMHVKSLPAEVRHADDVLVFLLDMIDTVRKCDWLPFAICFIKAYGDARVIAELKGRLAVPNGLARIWWEVRTNFAKTAKVKRRLEALRKALHALKLYPAVPARTRKRRRPSITCQITSPGIPTASSHARSIKESANAVSPGMPRRFPTRR